MPSNLQQFKKKAFAKVGVRAAYDELAEEFAFLDEALKEGLPQVADVGLASVPTYVNLQSDTPAKHRRVL